MKTIVSSVILLFVAAGSAAQSVAAADKLIPWAYVSQHMRKASKTVLGTESSVNVSIVARLTESDACLKGTNDGRLDINIQWFNAGDEAGAMMLQMMQDLNGILQEKERFQLKEESDDSGVVEEEWLGGTLWYQVKQRPCINEISGPTGVTQTSTHARFFMFNGSAIIKIESGGKNSLSFTKEVISTTLELINGFDFSTLKNLYGSE